MAIELMCKKLGMTQIFDESGACVPVTVLEASPNLVVQKKTVETDGYTALQLGFGERRATLFSAGERGHFEKRGLAPKRTLRECRVDAETAAQYEVGGEINCAIFEVGQTIDVIGISKGRGFQGVVKRYGFAISKRSHGTHEFFRHGGSIGAGSSPGEVIKGLKMPGQMGNERVTMRNAKIAKLDAEKNLVFVQGGVPGHRDAIVRIRAAVAPR